MKILVTGGLGFIGQHLLKKLKQVRLIDDELYVSDDQSTCDIDFALSKRNPISGIFLPGKIQDLDLDLKFDIIFHLAASARIGKSNQYPYEFIKNNVDSTLKVLEMARQHNSKVIFTSTSSLQPTTEFNNPYTFSKGECERLCRLYSELYGVSTAIARLYNVYGPNFGYRHENPPTVIEAFRRKLLSVEPLEITGDGSQRRDFCHVFDVVQGLIDISKLTCKAELFNLGTGTNYSIKEVADILNKARGNSLSNVKYINARTREINETLAEHTEGNLRIQWNPKIKLEDIIRNHELL